MINTKQFKLFLFFFAGISQVCYGQRANYKIERSVKAGDIIRTSYSDTPKVNLYQGNGRFGCSYGSLGLHNNPDKKNNDKYGQTEYMHIGYWVRAKFNGDYLLPVLKIYWQKEPNSIKNYLQQQSFYNGTLTTSFENSGSKINVETWFDPVDRDLTGVTINVLGKSPDIIVDPLENLQVHYFQNIKQEPVIIKHGSSYEIQQTCLNKRSSLFITTNTGIVQQGNKLVLRLHRGKNNVLISYNKPVQVTGKLSKCRSVKWWNNKWETTGNLLLPDTNAQRLWVRSMAYLLSTCNDDKMGLPPPNGLTGNIWPFAFPQDLSFIHAALLTTGNLNIAKAWVEYWANDIRGLKDYTKRLFGVEGIQSPWVYPYGPLKGFYDPSPPSRFDYEIHNSGYLCRMAYETAKYINNTAWTRKYAVELVKQTALFYLSIAKKGDDGLWHLFVKPSMGQDEITGPNQQDYLCALYSAEYCFQKAIEYNLDTDGAYKTILRDGLGFASLLSGKGFYFRDQGSKNDRFGNQKHPVQLNALTLLPVGSHADEPSLNAYKARYEITMDAKKPFFYGWTLGSFLLAGSRAGDVEGWKKDWANLRRSDYIDADWISIYEAGSEYNSTFYITTHGLVVQSLMSNLVSDWFGKLEIAKCNPWKEKVYVNKIYSLLGVYVSGEINGTDASLNLTGWKDCKFELCDKRLRVKNGQTIKVIIDNGILTAASL